MKILIWIGITLIAFVVFFVALSFTIGTKPDGDFMAAKMDKIESYFSYRNLANDKISQVNVAWQLDHILKSINNIIEKLADSDPENYSMNFNISRTLIFTRGDFPRGVAKAPASVIPPDVITNQELRDQLSIARKKVASLQYMHPKSSFEHDVFGLLDRNQTARLLEVHTDHHLKIIQDILALEGIVLN